MRICWFLLWLHVDEDKASFPTMLFHDMGSSFFASPLSVPAELFVKLRFVGEGGQCVVGVVQAWVGQKRLNSYI